MACLSRIVLPGTPHHVTQRGNRRERTFFEDGDYELYLDLLSDAAARSGVAIWSYCLMSNHVHIVAVSSDETGCAGRSATCTATIPAISMPARERPGICGRGGSVPSRWMRRIW